MKLRQRSDVVVEPITLAEAKTALRVYDTQSDDLISALITAGRQWAENYTSCSWAMQSFELAFDGAPPKSFKAPYPPLVSLDRISVIGADQVTRQYDRMEDWIVDTIGSTISLCPGVSLDPVQSVVVEYTAGSVEIPEIVKQAILLWVKGSFEAIPASEWMRAAERMLYPYKELSV